MLRTLPEPTSIRSYLCKLFFFVVLLITNFISAKEFYQHPIKSNFGKYLSDFSVEESTEQIRSLDLTVSDIIIKPKPKLLHAEVSFKLGTQADARGTNGVISSAIPIRPGKNLL